MTCDRQYRRAPKGGPPPRPCTGKTISARKAAAGRPVAGYEAVADIGWRQVRRRVPRRNLPPGRGGASLRLELPGLGQFDFDPQARSRTAPRRGRDRRRRISDWRRRRAAGSPWRRRDCRTSSPILRSSSTSSAPLPRCTERLRRSAGSSSTPCSASSASMLPAAFGAVAARVSSGAVVRVRQRKAGRAGSPRIARGRSKRGAVRSVDAHRRDLARR